MKKILCLVFILSIPYCYSQEINSNSYSAKPDEINLDLKTPVKSYNLQKNNNFNNPKLENNDIDDNMLFDVVTSPLQMLKQYQADKL